MLFKKIFHLLYVYYIKVIRNDAFINFSSKRRYLKNLSNKLEHVDKKFEKIANYYIPINFFTGGEVIASFGVGSDIEFENQMVNKFNHEIFLHYHSEQRDRASLLYFLRCRNVDNPLQPSQRSLQLLHTTLNQSHSIRRHGRR